MDVYAEVQMPQWIDDTVTAFVTNKTGAMVVIINMTAREYGRIVGADDAWVSKHVIEATVDAMPAVFKAFDIGRHVPYEDIEMPDGELHGPMAVIQHR